MPVNAAVLIDDIIGEFPEDWDWSTGTPNYTWLQGMCVGFQAMWTAGVTSPGLGPPPLGSYPHVHAITLIPALMSGSVPPYTPEAVAFTTNLCAVIASHLMLTTMVIMDGTLIGHIHLPYTFQSDTVLAAQIVSGAGVSGVAIQPWADGFAAGLINHVTLNAGMGPSTGGMGHIHTLL